MSLASVFLVDRMKGSLCGLAGAVQGEEVPNVRSRRPPGACAALNNEQAGPRRTRPCCLVSGRSHQCCRLQVRKNLQQLMADFVASTCSSALHPRMTPAIRIQHLADQDRSLSDIRRGAAASVILRAAAGDETTSLST